MTFRCPDCGNEAPVCKGVSIAYKKAFKRLYKCPCGTEFATEEVLALKRLRGRPKKTPELVGG